MRWTTGIGIAIGGTSGAIAALIGASRAPAPRAVSAAHAEATQAAAAAAPAPSIAPATEAATPAASATGAPAIAASAPTSATATEDPIAQALASATAAPPSALPQLEVPTTKPALLKAMLYCDQRRDFDACSTVAVALDTGTTGPADPEQAKRFRKIALTHLVAQCEAASPRACLVLAVKYRAGTELAQNVKGAEALEARAAELCRLRPGPDCPTP
jgi:hypothetical protein